MAVPDDRLLNGPFMNDVIAYLCFTYHYMFLRINQDAAKSKESSNDAHRKPDTTCNRYKNLK